MIIYPWIAELILISWRDFSAYKRPPLPSEFLASFIIFGSLGMVKGEGEKIAATFGWGLVLATFMRMAPNILPSGGLTTGNPADLGAQPGQSGLTGTSTTPNASLLPILSARLPAAFQANGVSNKVPTTGAGATSTQQAKVSQ